MIAPSKRKGEISSTTYIWKSQEFSRHQRRPTDVHASTFLMNCNAPRTFLFNEVASSHHSQLLTLVLTESSVANKTHSESQSQAPPLKASTSQDSVPPSCRATTTWIHHRTLQHLQGQADDHGLRATLRQRLIGALAARLLPLLQIRLMTRILLIMTPAKALQLKPERALAHPLPTKRMIT